MKISEHVYLLEVRTESFVCFPALLCDAGHLILVDAGYPGQTAAIAAAVAAEGFSISALTGLILTHQDIDHIGCAREIAALADGLETMAHVAEVPYIDGREVPIKLAALREGSADYNEYKRLFDGRRVPITRTLTDGETLPCCGGVEVVHTPGHTPGHLCLFVRQDSALICGDAMNIVQERLAGPNPAYTKDMAQAMASVRRMAEYDARVVLTYHGGAYRGSVRDYIDSE